MKTLMFYSYKAGSGRTIAAANVAAALTKLNKRVAIIDMNFDAPGLQYFFDTQYLSTFKNGIGVQHYLKSEIGLDELLNDVAIDVFGDNGPLLRFEVPSNSLLLYVMASLKVSAIDALDPKVAPLMRNLVAKMNDIYGLDYLIIDAETGIRASYSLVTNISDEMILFFRWSRQHVEGTIRLVRFMSRLKEFDQAWLPLKLVASASPPTTELASLADANIRETIVRTLSATRKRVEQALSEFDASSATLFFEIPEMLELKWLERLTVFDDAYSPYNLLARQLIQSDPTETPKTHL